MAAVRGGRSSSLVIVGPAGIGKSWLCRRACALADGFTVVGTRGMASETHLDHGGLFDVLSPLLPGRLDRLLTARGDALRGALRITEPLVADPFAVAVATLDLLTMAAEDAPVLVVVDDAPWVDAASLGGAAVRGSAAGCRSCRGAVRRAQRFGGSVDRDRIRVAHGRRSEPRGGVGRRHRRGGTGAPANRDRGSVVAAGGGGHGLRRGRGGGAVPGAGARPRPCGANVGRPDRARRDPRARRHRGPAGGRRDPARPAADLARAASSRPLESCRRVRRGSGNAMALARRGDALRRDVRQGPAGAR